MSRFNRSLDCKVYVGNLGPGASRHELEDAFCEYGELTNVWVARNPPGFAFVEFKSHHHAQDAVEAMDNRFVCGRRIVVEMSTGESRRQRGGGLWGRDSGGFPPRRPVSDEKCYECGERGHFARDCYYNRRRYRQSRSRTRSRSYSPRRRRSRSSNRYYYHDNSRSRSRSRSHSHYSPARRSLSVDRD